MSDTHNRTSETASHSGTDTTTAAEAKDAARSLKDDAEAKARNVGAQVAGEARDRADRAKHGVADEISSLSSALRRASDEVRDGSPQDRTFGYMANSLADLSDTVRGKDLGEVADDLGNFARRNPVAFLGGAALLGFAMVRMARASERRPRGDDHDDDDLPARRTSAGIPEPATYPVGEAPSGTGRPADMHTEDRT